MIIEMNVVFHLGADDLLLIFYDLLQEPVIAPVVSTDNDDDES